SYHFYTVYSTTSTCIALPSPSITFVVFNFFCSLYFHRGASPLASTKVNRPTSLASASSLSPSTSKVFHRPNAQFSIFIFVDPFSSLTNPQPLILKVSSFWALSSTFSFHQSQSSVPLPSTGRETLSTSTSCS